MFGTALVGTAANEAKAAAVRFARYLAIYIVAGALFLVAAVYASNAAYLRLAEVYGPIKASLIFCAIFLVLTIAVFSMSFLVKKKNQQETKIRATKEAGSLATVAAISALPALLRSRSIIAATGAALPLAIAVGAYLWARSSDGSFAELKKYIPGFHSDEDV